MPSFSIRGSRHWVVWFGAIAALVVFPTSLFLYVLARGAVDGPLLGLLLLVAASGASAVVGALIAWALGYLWRQLLADLRGLVSTDGDETPKGGERDLFDEFDRVLGQVAEEQHALRRRNDELETLAAVSHALDSASSAEQMLDALLGLLANLISYSRGYVAIGGEEAGVWRISASRGYTPGELDRVEVLEPGSKDVEQGVCLPLTTDSVDMGVVWLDVSSPDPEALNQARLLAESAALAVVRRRQYESTRREVRAQTLLNEAGRVLTSTLDKGEVLTRVMGEVTKALNAEAGSVLLVDEARGDMFFAAASSPAADLLLGERMALDQGIVGWTVRRQESVLVDDAHHDPRFYGQIDRRTGLHTRSVICVPLLIKDRVIGAIEVIDPRSGKFTEDDLRLLESLAPHAAIAIDNASLHESIKAQMEELERTQDQLLQAEKLSAIGQLVAGVAHELNNPLTAIVGYSQLLLEACQDPQIAEDLGRIEREAQRSARIVQNLLSFARQSKMEKRPIELGEVLNKTVDLLLYQLEVDNITVVRDISPESMSVLGDRYQLQQVFLNLITNAHQAMRKAHGLGTLTIRAYPTDHGTVRAQFIDDGPGISKENIGRIFDPFFTTKDVGEGTGLGLSICLGIVQEHQGQVRSESEEGLGATFTVELPMYTGPAESATPAESTAEMTPIGGKAILVVDDEVQIAMLLKRVLEAEGHRVTSVDSGIKAQAILDERSFDLVICDLKMPGISGRQLFTYLQKVRPEIAERVVFSTGDIVSDESWSFLQSVDNPYISKPFKPEQVLAMIREMWAG